LIINLVAQHDPEPNPEFASGGDPRFPQSFLYELAPIEAFQLWIAPYRVHRRLTPERAHQSVALLAQRT
jgi:hypothetical protein